MSFDLKVFNTGVHIALTETIDQQVNLFNEASSGAITLISTNQNAGDFAMQASFASIPGLIRRRDVYHGSNVVAEARLQELQNNSVKVPSGTPPIVWEAAQYNWVKADPASAALAIGEQLAVGILADMVNTAIAGATAAISSVPELNHTAADTPTFSDLVQGTGKFGDKMNSIAAWVLHSKSMTDLYQNALHNAEGLFTYGTVNVKKDADGRRFIMVDSESLVDSGKYKILGLVPGAAMVEQNQDFESNLVRENGTENIRNTFQAEWSYNIGLLGFSWNITNGGKAPTNTSINTPASWDRTATSVKDTAGVMITAN